MTLYILLLLGVVIIGIPLCDKKYGKWGRAIYCGLAAVVFIFIGAMRFKVGHDYVSYGGIYFNMKYMDIDDVAALRLEKGFIMPLYILNLALEDYRTVFIYTSIIIYASVFYLIYKNSSCPWISAAAYLCFGLFFNSLCFLRQTMAALLVAYAIRYVCEKRPLRFAVLIIAAATFHWSALIMLALYLLLRIKPDYIYLGIAAAGMVLFYIFSRPLMLWAIDKFYMYRTYDPTSSGEASIGLPIRYTIMFGVLFAVCFALRKRLIEKNHANAVYINCLMYTVIFEAMGARHGILSRFAVIVYIPAILYLLPDAVKVGRDFIAEKISDGKKRQLARYGAAAAAAVYSAGCFFVLMINNYNGTVPYTFYSNRPYDIFVEQLLEEGTDDYDDPEEDDDYDSFVEEDEEFDEDHSDIAGGQDGVITDNGEDSDDYDDYDDYDDFDSDALEKEILDQLEGL